MGQALYRKYRTTSLTETAGQEHVTQALQEALKSDRLSHAYLFTGPRGVGKTSIARIMAYAINDIPYSSDPHLDIIEIDAASNRRIDEIRDLRDKVYIAPTSAKYKVYIIDEVHMLTREAFNALLKTLEEPPAHVVFILATTDSHKLPETIVSRTQRYNFKPIDTKTAVKRLRYIADQEKIAIDDEALALLAEHGAGSFRDSISMLDQVSNLPGNISAEAVRDQLGIPSREAIMSLLESLKLGELIAPVMALQALSDQGYRAATIAEQLSQLLRGEVATGKTTLSLAATLDLLQKLLDVVGAYNPERYLELTLLQAIIPNVVTVPPPNVASPKPALKPVPVAEEKPVPPPSAEPELEEPTVPAPVKDELPKSKRSAGSTSLTDDTWNNVLAELKKQYNTIYGIVRMAHTDFSDPEKVGLSFAFAFHQKRISDVKNRKIVTDTIEHVTGQRVELVCSVSKEPKARAGDAKTATKSKNPPKDAALQDISSVFGGGELL